MKKYGNANGLKSRNAEMQAIFQLKNRVVDDLEDIEMQSCLIGKCRNASTILVRKYGIGSHV